MLCDILTELRKCKANAAKKSHAVAVDRIGSMFNHGGLATAGNRPLSHAEYLSRPLPVFTKLAIALRNIPALQFVFAKFAALLRSGKGSAESPVVRFVGEIPDVTGSADRHFTGRKAAGDCAIATPESNDGSEREKLIRRRWTETGIKMWNANVHGAGHAALNIQGRTELLPVKPGETLPGYDKLEYRLIAGRIVCEGIVVDPPKPRK